MRVKICGIRNEEDLKCVADSGADAAGFLVGQLHSSPDFILASTAARLCHALPPYVSPVIVTHLTDPEDILDLVVQTGITSIQLHGGSTPEQVMALRDMLPPGAKLILGTHLESERSFPALMDFYRLVDGILLDSCDPVHNRVGGTGMTHDWKLSAKFVSISPIPVILAGGLTPENVGEAIRTVGPYAVDVNTAMKREEDGSLSAEKCQKFVAAARSAAELFHSPKS